MSQVETGTITTKVPARLDRLPWSRWHWMIIIGLGTRWVAFLLSGEMAFAYFMSHAGTVMGPLNAPPGPGPHSFFPHLNGGEITVLYCFLWLYLASRGPGRFSVDAALGLE